MRRQPYKIVAMPHVDEGAKSFELGLAERVGHAVAARRKALGLTAVELAERTAKLGYPVSRVAISKIENSTRAGKFDVAELLVLAHALEVPPALLLFPDFPQLTVKVLPRTVADSEAAVGWLSGRSGWQVAPDGAGTGLVEDVARRRELKSEIFRATLPSALSDEVRASVVAELTAQLAATEKRIDSAKTQLWGEHDG
jgi:transcriptional regulator with XRE-family HTH domain